MKTIFISISRGFLARNILQTDVFRELLERGHRVVIATPAHQDPDFLAEFGRPHVAFVPWHIPHWTRLDRLLVGLHRNLLWNETVRFTSKYGVYDPTKVPWWRYGFQLLFWRPLAHLAFLRRGVRRLDAWLRPAPEEIRRQLAEIRPDVVFSTNPMEDADSFYLKAARGLGIPSIGLVKSWDNMSKTSFRILPDYALVWAPYMTDEAVRYQLYPPTRVFEVGVPQFDSYVRNEGQKSREEFLQAIGLDPDRATILFGSEGKVTPHDPEIVALISEMIARNEFPKPAQVLVRPHYGYRGDIEKFDPVASLPHVVVDRFFVPRPVFYDQWDFSAEHYRRLAESLRACDVLITTASTLAIDAAASHRPVVAIAFDGFKKLPPRESVARWYETEYYSDVLRTGAVSVAYNAAELRAALSAALAMPERRADEREVLVRRFVGITDGFAGKRIATFVAAVAETGKPPLI